MSLIKVIGANDLSKLINISEAIDVLRTTYSMFDNGSIKLVDRTILSVNNDTAYALIMPSYLSMFNSVSVKISTIFPSNNTIGLPLIDALVVFVNGKNGQVEMIIEGKSLTAMRTGAMCGLATSLVTPINVKTMAIIGAGVQARAVISAVYAVRDIENIKIYSRTIESAKKLKSHIEITYPKINAEIVTDPNHAVEDVDIISTCTSNSSRMPVFTNCNLKEGVHINAIGGPGVDSVELPIELYKNSLAIVEDIHTAKHESGEIKLGCQHNYLNNNNLVAIGSVINRKFDVNKKRKISIYRSVGMAIQDTALAAKIYEKSNYFKINQININS